MYESEHTPVIFLSFQMAEVKLSASQDIIGKSHLSIFLCLCELPRGLTIHQYIWQALETASNHYCDLYEPDRNPICFIFKHPSSHTIQQLFGKIEHFSVHILYLWTGNCLLETIMDSKELAHSLTLKFCPNGSFRNWHMVVKC